MMVQKENHPPMALPSGKHTKNYGKSPFLIKQSTINGPFSTAMLNYQRVIQISDILQFS